MLEEYTCNGQIEATSQLEKYIQDNKILEDGEKPLKKMIVITIGKNETFYEELN